MTTREVAELLNCSMETVRCYSRLGYITGTARSGARGGRAQRLYFDPEEVRAFLHGNAPGAQAYREKKKLPPSRRRAGATR